MMTIEIRIEEITPTIARAYLGMNQKNRAVRKARVEQYAADMKAGAWRVSGESIKFDRRGNLIDGQHRCHGIIEANVPVQMIVVRGLDPEVMDVVDSGAGRSAGDVLGLRGLENAHRLAAVVAVHRAWRLGMLRHCMATVRAEARGTHSQVVEHVRAYPELVEVTEFASSVCRSIRIPVGAVGVAYLEMMRIDPELARDMFDRIRTFRGGDADDPVAVFLQRYNREVSRGARLLPSTALYMLVRTWNALRAGKPISSFVFGSNGSWSEIPEIR